MICRTLEVRRYTNNRDWPDGGVQRLERCIYVGRWCVSRRCIDQEDVPSHVVIALATLGWDDQWKSKFADLDGVLFR